MTKQLRNSRPGQGCNLWFPMLSSVLLGGSMLMAQITLSTIRGTASDPTGAVVPNAVIVISSLDTSARREVVTDENGNYEVPDLPRGRYRLNATASGFKTFVADTFFWKAARSDESTRHSSSVR